MGGNEKTKDYIHVDSGNVKEGLRKDELVEIGKRRVNGYIKKISKRVKPEGYSINNRIF